MFKFISEALYLFKRCSSFQVPVFEDIFFIPVLKHFSGFLLPQFFAKHVPIVMMFCVFFQQKPRKTTGGKKNTGLQVGRIITTNDHHMFQPRPVPHENENTRGLPPWMAPAGCGSLGVTKGWLGDQQKRPPSPQKGWLLRGGGDNLYT